LGNVELTKEPQILRVKYDETVCVALETNNGKYFVKSYTAKCDSNPVKLPLLGLQKQMEQKNKIAMLAAKQLSVMCSIEINGSSSWIIQDRLYIVYNFCQGLQFTKAGDFTPACCEKIGSILARIHNMELPSITSEPPPDYFLVNWERYLYRGKAYSLTWVDVLAKNLNTLQYMQSKAFLAYSLYRNMHTTVSHADLNPTNVLWQNDTPIIIDWDDARPLNELQDFIHTLVTWCTMCNRMPWSVSNINNFFKTNMIAFVKGYLLYRELKVTDWKFVLYLHVFIFINGIKRRISESFEAIDDYNLKEQAANKVVIVIEHACKLFSCLDVLAALLREAVPELQYNCYSYYPILPKISFCTLHSDVNEVIELYHKIENECDEKRKELINRTPQNVLLEYLYPRRKLTKILVYLLIDQKILVSKCENHLQNKPYLNYIFKHILKIFA